METPRGNISRTIRNDWGDSIHVPPSFSAYTGAITSQHNSESPSSVVISSPPTQYVDYSSLFVSASIVHSTNIVVTSNYLSTSDHKVVTVTQGVKTITVIVYQDSNDNEKTATIPDAKTTVVSGTDSQGSAALSTETVYPVITASPSLVTPSSISSSSPSMSHQGKVALAVAFPVGSVAVIGALAIFLFMRKKRSSQKRRLNELDTTSSSGVDYIYPEVKRYTTGSYSPYD